MEESRHKFSEFITLIRKLTGTDYEVIKLLQKRFNKASTTYIESDDFRTLVETTKSRIHSERDNTYVLIKEFVTELRAYEQKDPCKPENTFCHQGKRKHEGGSSSETECLKAKKIKTEPAVLEEEPLPSAVPIPIKQEKEPETEEKSDRHHREKHRKHKDKKKHKRKSEKPRKVERKKEERERERKSRSTTPARDFAPPEEPPVEETSGPVDQAVGEAPDNRTEQEKKNDRHARKLEKLLERVSEEIKKLESRELSLDDMEDESTYTLLDKYKKKSLKIWQMLCEIRGRAPVTGRRIEEKFRYDGTRYPKLNQLVEKFINKYKQFPDYTDIKEIVSRCNTKYKLKINKKMQEMLSKDIFTEVGNKLQERRQQDLVENFGTYLTDNLRSYDDPAMYDRELRAKLETNRIKSKSNLEAVIKKYAYRQERDGDGTDDEEDEDELEQRQKEEEERRKKKEAKRAARAAATVSVPPPSDLNTSGELALFSDQSPLHSPTSINTPVREGVSPTVIMPTSTEDATSRTPSPYRRSPSPKPSYRRVSTLPVPDAAMAPGFKQWESVSESVEGSPLCSSQWNDDDDDDEPVKQWRVDTVHEPFKQWKMVEKSEKSPSPTTLPSSENVKLESDNVRESSPVPQLKVEKDESINTPLIVAPMDSNEDVLGISPDLSTDQEPAALLPLGPPLDESTCDIMIPPPPKTGVLSSEDEQDSSQPLPLKIGSPFHTTSFSSGDDSTVKVIKSPTPVMKTVGMVVSAHEDTFEIKSSQSEVEKSIELLPSLTAPNSQSDAGESENENKQNPPTTSTNSETLESTEVGEKEATASMPEFLSDVGISTPVSMTQVSKVQCVNEKNVMPEDQSFDMVCEDEPEVEPSKDEEQQKHESLNEDESQEEEEDSIVILNTPPRKDKIDDDDDDDVVCMGSVEIPSTSKSKKSKKSKKDRSLKRKASSSDVMITREINVTKQSAMTHVSKAESRDKFMELMRSVKGDAGLSKVQEDLFKSLTDRIFPGEDKGKNKDNEKEANEVMDITDDEKVRNCTVANEEVTEIKSTSDKEVMDITEEAPKNSEERKPKEKDIVNISASECIDTQLSEKETRVSNVADGKICADTSGMKEKDKQVNPVESTIELDQGNDKKEAKSAASFGSLNESKDESATGDNSVLLLDSESQVEECEPVSKACVRNLENMFTDSDMNAVVVIGKVTPDKSISSPKTLPGRVTASPSRSPSPGAMSATSRSTSPFKRVDSPLARLSPLLNQPVSSRSASPLKNSSKPSSPLVQGSCSKPASPNTNIVCVSNQEKGTHSDAPVSKLLSLPEMSGSGDKEDEKVGSVSASQAKSEIPEKRNVHSSGNVDKRKDQMDLSPPSIPDIRVKKRKSLSLSVNRQLSKPTIVNHKLSLLNKHTDIGNKPSKLQLPSTKPIVTCDKPSQLQSLTKKQLNFGGNTTQFQPKPNKPVIGSITSVPQTYQRNDKQKNIQAALRKPTQNTPSTQAAPDTMADLKTLSLQKSLGDIVSKACSLARLSKEANKGLVMPSGTAPSTSGIVRHKPGLSNPSEHKPSSSSSISPTKVAPKAGASPIRLKSKMLHLSKKQHHSTPTRKSIPDFKVIDRNTDSDSSGKGPNLSPIPIELDNSPEKISGSPALTIPAPAIPKPRKQIQGTSGLKLNVSDSFKANMKRIVSKTLADDAAKKRKARENGEFVSLSDDEDSGKDPAQSKRAELNLDTNKDSHMDKSSGGLESASRTKGPSERVFSISDEDVDMPKIKACKPLPSSVRKKLASPPRLRTPLTSTVSSNYSRNRANPVTIGSPIRVPAAAAAAVSSGQSHTKSHPGDRTQFNPAKLQKPRTGFKNGSVVSKVASNKDKSGSVILLDSDED